MSKILAIDYGLKRCGIALSDDAKIIASPLTTVPTTDLDSFLHGQITQNKVNEIVLGLPVKLNGEDTHITTAVKTYCEKLKNMYPTLMVALYDERFTSSMAQHSIGQMQLPKNKREQKGLIDKVSAAILLQSYMASIQRTSTKM